MILYVDVCLCLWVIFLKQGKNEEKKEKKMRERFRNSKTTVAKIRNGTKPQSIPREGTCT